MAEMADGTNFVNNKPQKTKRTEKTPAFNFMTDIDVKLPNIGSESSTISQLKIRISELEIEVKDKEHKCQALTRNFESLSALCVKAENEKQQHKKLAETLQAENREQSKEILD